MARPGRPKVASRRRGPEVKVASMKFAVKWALNQLVEVVDEMRKLESDLHGDRAVTDLRVMQLRERLQVVAGVLEALGWRRS